MTYFVSFAQWYTYDIEAENMDEAIEKAQDEFAEDMTSLVANTEYDNVIVENEDGKVLYEM